MDGVVEPFRGSIRIQGRNKATMSAEGVEVNTDQDRQKSQNEDQTETRTALKACKTIHVPPITQIPDMGRGKLSGLIQTEPKYSGFVNNRLKISNGAHEINSDVPFMVIVSSFSNTRRRILKQMVVGNATLNQKLIIPLRLDPSLVAHVNESLGQTTKTRSQNANRLPIGKISSPIPQN